MKTKIITALILSVLVISCKNKTEQNAEIDSGLVEITKAQFEAEKMTIGDPESYTLLPIRFILQVQLFQP